jgi:branched-chain amino acid transport system permease protein
VLSREDWDRQPRDSTRGTRGSSILSTTLVCASMMGWMPTFFATGIGQLPETLASGIVNGCIYALAAVSLLVVYNVTGVINFAVGDFLMAGAMLTLLFAGPNGEPHRLPLALAVLLAVVIVTVLGGLLELLVIHPRRRQGTIFLLILTIGISSVLEGGALIPTGSLTYGLRPFTGGPAVSLAGVLIPRQDFWIVGSTLLVMGLLWYGATRTRAGKALRACEVNPTAARLVGIRVDRYWTIAFALGALLAAFAGAILVPVTYATYDMGIPITLKAFVAWILGGAESPVGAVAGGVGFGVLEAVVLGYSPASVANYGDAVPLLLLIVALVIRRRGLTRQLAVTRV